MKKLAIVMALLASAIPPAWAWGPEGHSIVAEIAQRRLSPAAQRTLERLLGRGHSLASVASWADDVREKRPSTKRWHFVDIPVADSRYDPVSECKQSDQGDCIIAELDRLKRELRCATSLRRKQEALKFAVHFVGDLHQPLHTVAEEVGGNTIPVQVSMRGLKCTGKCQPKPFESNFHAAWDVDLIQATVWDWGAYVDRLEERWLKSAEAHKRGIDGGSPLQWALETHAAAKTVWDRLPADHVLDDSYYLDVLPIMDRQLGLAGLRLARFLNEAYANNRCSAK
jgi:S1/P1 Nuclease